MPKMKPKPPLRVPVDDEATWHEHRRKNVGSSEIAALYGVSKYDTPFSLYHRKRGTLPYDDADNDRMMWGRALEPGIAAGLSEQEGLAYRAASFYCVSQEVPGMAASMDFEAYSEKHDAWVPFEIKNVDFFRFKDEWDTAAEPPDPPLSMSLQVQQQMAITNSPVGYLGVLIGGNEGHLFEVKPIPKLIADIKKRTGLFWADVESGNEPEPVVPDDVVAMTRTWLETVTGDRVMKGDEALEGFLKLYAEGQLLAKTGKNMQEVAKGEVMKLAGDAEKILLDGGSIGLKFRAGQEVTPKPYTVDPYRDVRLYPSKKLKALVAGGDEENSNG